MASDVDDEDAQSGLSLPLAGFSASAVYERRGKACQHILAAYTTQEPVYIRPSKAAKLVRKVVAVGRHLESLSLLCLVFLSIFERPVWCVEHQHPNSGVYPCETKAFPGWGHTYLSIERAFAWEFVFLGTQLLFLAGHTFAGGRSYFRPVYHKLHGALLLAAIVDATIAVATPATVPRVATFIRISLLANRSPDIRRELWMIARIVPALSSVLVLTLVLLAFFSFFGLVLFHKQEPHFFGTFGRAAWQLWVLMTTSNFPDIMMTVYNAHRASAFFFIVFILLATFFMMNLFTAAAYLHYQQCEQEFEQNAVAQSRGHLSTAFDLLDADKSGYLDREEVLHLVAELRKAHLLPGIAQAGSATNLLFAMLDADGTERVSREEFMQLVTVLRVQWEEEEVVTYLERHWPRLYHSSLFQGVRAVVLSDAFQWGCDLTVLLMCAATVWETLARFHAGRAAPATSTDGRIDSFWDVIELVFTIFFAFEVLLKLVVYGWRAYWRDFTNRLEFVVAIGCVLMSVVVYIPSVLTNNSTWIRYTFSLRLVRLFGRMLRMGRLLQFPSMLRFLYVFVSVEHIKVFYLTFLSMLPPASRLFKVMFCIVYAYAALGVALFGGQVNMIEGDARHEQLASMAYGQNGYWTINLNDMPSGMMLMFQMLIVNNWMVFAEAYGALKGFPAWTFFITFYSIGVIAGLNVLVSFVLDAFISEMHDDEAKRSVLGEDLPQDSDLANIGGRAHPYAVINPAGINDAHAEGRKWRASMKGYETSSRKAKMLLNLLKRMSQNGYNEGSDNGYDIEAIHARRAHSL